MPSLPTTCPSIPTSLLTLLSILNEYLTTQLGLGLAPSVSVPGTVDSWLSSGLLVGRTEKENKILLGSRSAEQAEKDVFAYCPLWSVSPPSGQLHCGLFLEDSLSPESCTSGLLLSSAFWKVFRQSTVFDPFLSSLVVLVQAHCVLFYPLMLGPYTNGLSCYCFSQDSLRCARVGLTHCSSIKWAFTLHWALPASGFLFRMGLPSGRFMAGLGFTLSHDSNKLGSSS